MMVMPPPGRVEVLVLVVAALRLVVFLEEVEVESGSLSEVEVGVGPGVVGSGVLLVSGGLEVGSVVGSVGGSEVVSGSFDVVVSSGVVVSGGGSEVELLLLLLFWRLSTWTRELTRAALSSWTASTASLSDAKTPCWNFSGR